MHVSGFGGGAMPLWLSPCVLHTYAYTTSSRTEWSLVGHDWILTESSQKRGGHSEDLVRIAGGPGMRSRAG